MKTLIDGNNFISHYIKNNKSCAVGKIGGTELKLIYGYMNNFYSPDLIKEATEVSGVCPYSFENFHKFAEMYLQDLQQIDMLAVWSRIIPWLEIQLCEKIQAYPTRLQDLEPYFFDKPWTHKLLNKKVLVISPFAKSIEKQFFKKNQIWPNNLLPDFELKTIRYTNSAALDKSNTKSIFENIDETKNKINNIDYDVLIAGIGAASIPIIAFAKKQGKIGIHLGGPTQILFGVKGRRWEEIKEFNPFFNDYWIRPDLSETPSNIENVEGGCYW